MKKELLVIIPAYNEGEGIRQVLNDIFATEIRLLADILIINDGSKDNTLEVVQEYDVKVLSLVINLGYGSAIQSGYKYAKDHGYEYVIQLDSDGQHDICNVKRIFAELKGTNGSKDELPDIVIGSRFLSAESTFVATGMKKIAIQFFRILIKVFTKQSVSDPTSGLQGLNRRTFIYYSEYGNYDYKYPDINMIIQMLMIGYKIKEVPAVMHERMTGESMHTGMIKQLKYMVIMMLSTLSIIIRNIKVRHI